MPARLLAWSAAALSGRIYGRYLVASIASLGMDLAVFLALLYMDVPAIGASALGYGCGIMAHWLLSTRFVFDDGMDATGGQRARQKGLFIVTALIGLCITTMIVGAADMIGLDARFAKIVAIVISFQATYFARRTAIFRA